MKRCTFYLFDYPWIKKVVLYDCTFEIYFVYERKCGDMMFCNLNFEMKYLTLVSSALSTGIIVDTIWPLSTGILVDTIWPLSMGYNS